MATKKCPYCGEEIQEEAKKCRYCGEWVVDKENASTVDIKPEQNEEELDSDALLKSHIPFSDLFIKILFWIAILGLIISSVHDMMPEGQTFSTSIGSGKSRLLKEFLNICLAIPEWIGILIEGVAFTILFSSLMSGMKYLKNSFRGLFSSYLIFFIIAQLLLLVGSITTLEDGVSLLGLLIIIALIVIQYVLGFKLNSSYQGAIKKLGGVFILCASLLVVNILLYAIVPATIYLGDNEVLFDFFMAVYSLVTDWILFAAIKNVQLSEVEEE